MDELLGAFHDRFGEKHTEEDLVGARAPGRVNLMGGHTDYNDGFVLPVTIDRAVYAFLRRRGDYTIRLRSVNFEETVEYSLLDPPFSSLPRWACYAAGVAQELHIREGLDAGFEGILFGNVPLGSGLGSSAALEVATAVALETLFGLSVDPVTTARLCQYVEHTYVDVQCGIMDQMASRLGRTGEALALDCRSLDYKHVPLPLDEARLVIADTQVSRELAVSTYNERRAECEECVAFFQQFDDQIDALRDVPPVLFEERGDRLPTPLYNRCRHVITENQRVTESLQLLKEERLDTFGRLMNASHQSLRDDYEVSSAELNVLAETAQNTDGVFGARMTGAGFGGCIVCLVHESALSSLHSRLQARYNAQFDHDPALYVLSKPLEATSISIDDIQSSS